MLFYSVGKALISGELEEGVYRGMGAHRPVINRREGAVAAGKYTGYASLPSYFQ